MAVLPKATTLVVLVTATWAVAVLAPGQAQARNTKRTCKEVNGLPLLAYNLTCRRALRYLARLPRGWSGANSDTTVGNGLPSGVVLLFRQRDMEIVSAASRRPSRKPVLSQLAGRPSVWAAMPYGN